MITQLGIGTHPNRVDLTVHAGDPVEHLIPVYDAAGVLLDLSTWTATATVLQPGGAVLGTLTVDHGPTGLLVHATPAETTGWAATWPTYSPWRIAATHPSGEPIFRATGWLSLYP